MIHEGSEYGFSLIMIFDKTSLATLFAVAHLALLACAEAEAQFSPSRAELGQRRKFLVVRRKKLQGLESDEESLEVGDNDFRAGKSLVGNNFRRRVRQHAVSSFAGLHNQQEPYSVKNQQNRVRVPLRQVSRQRQHHQQSGQQNQARHKAPVVPGLDQHRLALQAHEAQIQAHLALARGHKINKGHHQGPSHLNHIVLENTRKPVQVIQPLRIPARVEPQSQPPQPAPFKLDHQDHHDHRDHQDHLDHQAPLHVDHHVEEYVEPQAFAAPAIQPQAIDLRPVEPQAFAAPGVVQLQPIDFRQGFAGPIDLEAVAIAGERCIDKIVNVEETEYEETIDCHHSYNQKCHTTYTTDFAPQQEEECEENFKKDCFIEYNKVAHNESVEFCHTPVVKDCNIPGPVECRTEYESECETHYHEHVLEEDVPECETIKEYKCETVQSGYSTEEKCKEWPKERCTIRKELVRKVTPETGCKKVPKEKCAPAGCGFVPGVQECFDKTETVIQEIPEEKCNLEPSKSCKHVTKLVPKLEPSEECVDVPKEVCVRSNGNPRKVTKPVVKKWCYTPTPESGLF